MININDYLSIEKILELCRTINIPEDITEKVVLILEGGEPEKAAPYFEGLFNKDTAEDAAQKINDLFPAINEATKKVDFSFMTVFLAAALRRHEIYVEQDIDLNIYYDTMSCFRTVLERDRALYGEYSFRNTSFWYYRQFTGQIYKLGTLEFEMLYLHKELADICKMSEGDLVLSVHIPFKSNMTRENLDGSYNMAKAFYAKHYPEFKDAPFYCGTWLLAPSLKTFLPPDSKILEFQSDFNIVDINPEAKDCMFWVFGQQGRDSEYTQLPENTSLQKAIKNHLLNGGNIGSAIGLIYWEAEKHE